MQAIQREFSARNHVEHTEEKTLTSNTPKLPLRLPYIDGLRALAALAVVLLHSFEMHGLGIGAYWGLSGSDAGLSESAVGRMLVTLYEASIHHAATAVQVFIVLSGYSLMIPVARSLDGKIKGGALTFFKRRARRILPPYFAVVVLSLLLIALVPGMGTQSGRYVYWDIALPVFQPDILLSHLLLVHNASSDWFQKINPPLWSIAVEWQIYFLFPLLVLLWRARGLATMVLVAIGVGIGQAYLPITFPLSHSWFLGLFAIGAAAAVIGLSDNHKLRALRERMPWLPLMLAFALVYGVTKVLGSVLSPGNATSSMVEDTLIGFSVGCLLIYCARQMEQTGSRQPLTLRVLNARPLVTIGTFSYSLYLIHAPVLALLALACRALNVDPVAAHLTTLVIGVPLSLLAAYPFYLAFERPFMGPHGKPVPAKQAA